MLALAERSNVENIDGFFSSDGLCVGELELLVLLKDYRILFTVSEAILGHKWRDCVEKPDISSRIVPIVVACLSGKHVYDIHIGTCTAVTFCFINVGVKTFDHHMERLTKSSRTARHTLNGLYCYSDEKCP